MTIENNEVLNKHHAASFRKLSWLNVSSQFSALIDEPSREGI